MKNVYKMIALTVFGFAMVFGQEAFAQRNGIKGQKDKGRQNDQTEFQDLDWDYNDDRNFRRGHSNRDFKGRRGRHGSYQDLEISWLGQPYRIGTIYFHHERAYAMKLGVFYTKRHRNWIQVQAPYGMQVDFIPHRANMVYSRRGILHEFRGTYYQELRRGVVIVPPPKRLRYPHRW